MEIPKEIIVLIKKARIQADKFFDIKNKIFNYFDENNIDLYEYEGGCNSDNLNEMLNCYIDYDDDSLEELLERIKSI